MDRIKIVIIDDSEEIRNNVKVMLSFDKRFEVIGEAGNGEEGLFITKEARPDIVLLDINMPVIDGITAAQEITLNISETSVIMMSVQGESEYMRKAMSSGARAYLMKPFTSDELSKTILKTYEMENKRREVSTGPKVQETIKSKVITVFSTKGGVGKTTIASNLAVSIARSTKKKVALVDLDLQFGDVAIMLNVSVKNTISDIIKEIGQLDSNLMDEIMVSHFSGVKVLPAPIKPEYAEFITSQHTEKIIRVLKETCHYIIIDTSASFHETVLTSLDMADRILLVSTLDLPTIKNVKAGLDVMESLHYPKDKISIVLNKASEQFGIKYKDFESTLKHPIWSFIPEDSQTVITSANKGFPFVMTRTETKVAKAISIMANDIVNNTENPGKAAGFTKKVFG